MLAVTPRQADQQCQSISPGQADGWNGHQIPLIPSSAIPAGPAPDLLRVVHDHGGGSALVAFRAF